MKRIRMLPVILACALVSTFLMLVAQSTFIPSAVFNAGTPPPTPMSVVRNGASSGVLSDGRVLISGGNDASGTPHASVEVLGSGASAGTMTMPRSGHISVALKDGTVLLAGGTTTGGAVTNAAEIFNPATGASTAIASLLVARAGATATLLSDGSVLIAGGQGSGSPLQTMEIFDPVSGQFSNAAPMTVARQNHAAALLGDGRVLLVGGSDGSNPLASVEVYDPAANSVSALPNMSTARAGLSATTLLKGKVLLAGGGSASTEILDPVASSISPGPSMTVARTGHLALLLPNNNTVLMVAGSDSAAAEIFAPWAANWQGAFAAFGTMANPRTGASGGASGQSGIAFVAGGQVSGGASNTVDVVRFPMVKTDKEDYSPGETVTMTGSGFQPGETVTLVLEEVPYLDTHGPYQAVAGADGTFSNTQFTVDAEDANIRFYLSATGATSGLTAGKTFTDSVGFNGLTVGAQSPGTVPQGGSATYTITVKFNGNGSGTCTVGSFSISGAPAGVTAVSPADFSPSSVTSTDGTDKTVTMTVHTTGATPVGNYTGGSAITVAASGTGGNCNGTNNNTKFNLSVGNPTTLTLAAPSPASVTSGSAGPVTLTATLTRTSSGAGVNSQTITFKVDGTTVGTGTSNSSGLATFSYNPSGLGVGPHTVQAFYDGGSSASILYGASTSGTQTLTVTSANTAPTAASQSVSTAEDTPLLIILSGTDTSPAALTFSIVTPPSAASGTLGSLGAPSCSLGTCTATVTFTPTANYNGPASFTFKTNDGSLDSTNGTVSITVTPVNDVPSFTKGADATVLEDAAAYSAAWATAISAGPPNESSQTLTFNVTGNTNSALFSVQPAVAANGTLSFTPAANANGTATITINLQDNGGTANGGVDTSAPQTFVINVTAVNDAPAFALGANPTVLEDAAAQSIAGFASGISAGPADEASQTLTFTTTNDNNPLFSVQPSIAANGTLTYTPAADANGSAMVTVKLKDNGGIASGGVDETTHTFTIYVTPVNDVPSFTKGADVTVLEDAAAYTAAWAMAIGAGPPNESSQTLTFHVTGNTNSALFSAQPAVAANGMLSFTAAANANGSATITINLQDNGGTLNGGVDTSAPQTFVINVTAVNDGPTVTLAGNQSVAEDSGPQTGVSFATGVTSGPSDESGQALTWTVTNNNNALFSSQPSINPATGTLSYTPAADANGTATVTVKIQDDGGVLNGGVDTVTKTFTITVWEVNDAPTASTDSATTDEDTPKTFDPRGNDSKGPANESGQTLTITSITQPSHGAASIVSSGTQINYSPSQDYNGPDSMTYTVCDNGTTNGSQDFKCSTATVNFTVNSVNDAPVVYPLTTSALSILENGSVTTSGTFADPDIGDTHTVVISWGDGSSSTLPGLPAGVFAFGPVTHTYLDDNPTGTASDTYPLTVTVRDAGIPAPVMFGSNGVVVTVNNVAPEITGITAPGPTPVGTPVSIVTNFSDPGTTDTFTCIVTWDDAVTSTGTAAASATNPKACTASRTFPATGVFGFSVSITDDDTGSDAETYTGYVVVYDPNGGFVTGGGWITSPAGAYLADVSLSGKANFGFVSKYQKGAKMPTGETEFEYKVGNLNFHSTVYEWLVVAGTKAQYKGSGTINGAGDYGFMLTAVDGSPDTFRMKIWDKSTGNIVYDSGLGGSDDIDTSPNTPLGGGSIVIHK